MPFNQKWTLEPGDNFESYLGKFSVGSHKTMRYLLQRFVDPGAITVVADAADSWEEISKHMDQTALAFDERCRTSVYNNAGFRKAAKATVARAAALGQLRLATAVDLSAPDSEPVGLGVIVTPTNTDEVIFLMNLYHGNLGSVSNAMYVGLAPYSLSRGLRLDALRGAFGLKARYGLSPQPQLALVQVPNWTVRPQTDLDQDALLSLYGGTFGRTGPPTP